VYKILLCEAKNTKCIKQAVPLCKNAVKGQVKIL